MKWYKATYRVARSVLFTAVLAVAAIFSILYVALTVPAVQDAVRREAEERLSELLGGTVGIGRVSISPFNEVVLRDVSLAGPDGARCLDAGTLGAGISLWSLVVKGNVEITYVELLDFDARLWQSAEGEPLNIDFIIRALSPKDKTKPPARFDLRIHNIVIRGGRISFDRRWLPRDADSARIDFNHIDLRNFRADVALPRLSNDSVTVDLRRMAFSEGERLKVEKIAAHVDITPTSLGVRGLEIALPGTLLAPADISVGFPEFSRIGEALGSGFLQLVMLSNKVTPADFSGFYPPLAALYTPFDLSISAGGNLGEVSLERLEIAGRGCRLEAGGTVSGLRDAAGMHAVLSRLSFDFAPDFVDDITEVLPPSASGAVAVLSRLGRAEGVVSGSWDAAGRDVSALGYVATGLGRADFDASVVLGGDAVAFSGNVSTDAFDLGGLLDSSDVGNVAFEVSGDVSVGKGDPLTAVSGDVALDVDFAELRGRRYEDISVEASKTGRDVRASLSSGMPGLALDGSLSAVLDGAASVWKADIDLHGLDTAVASLSSAQSAYTVDGHIVLDAAGNSVDDITGMLRLDDMTVVNPAGSSLSLHRMLLTSEIAPSVAPAAPLRHMQLNLDFMHAYVQGDFSPSRLPAMIRYALASALPSVFPPAAREDFGGAGVFSISVDPDDGLTSFLDLPVRIPVPVEVKGSFDGATASAGVSTRLPYLVKGRDKLIRDIFLTASLDGDDGALTLEAGMLYPAKKGDLKLDVFLNSQRDLVKLDLDFNRNIVASFYGSLSLGASFRRNTFDGLLEADMHVYPSSFVLNSAEWKMGEADVSYADRRLEVSGISLRHDDQFVLVDGAASADPADVLSLRLADIDLSYIFDTLNINYVTFGGVATGEVETRKLFTSSPEAYTKSLHVKNLAYNGAVLGDGELSSSFDAPAKRIAIGADISEQGRRCALIDGGIWLGRDSLSFDIDADKVDIRFLQPFMQAFSSKVEGRASGKAKLYGTFRDIDLAGRLKADTISMLVDYTNVVYSGSDSVIIDPGHIRIPAFRLYDRYGHSGVLTGEVRHTYFHEPSFRFDVSGVRDMLCYDTDAKINPDWYGVVFASGNARISGRPGFVEVFADMRTDRNTAFTFVLSDYQQAADYSFLSFTDRRKEKALREVPASDRPAFLKEFEKMRQEMQGPPSVFSLDLRVTATPEARMVIVMDPQAGDRITAYGSGAMNITYSSDDDEMRMYGKYILDRGVYNFSLQDIILKDFTIKPGSEISFTGDPLAGMLDITAAYRVNTSLTDLDESFATDRELNRTNVPVEALLKVHGVMTNPDISFDIDLPTVTEETLRKVKSIISTEDLMSRQVIYLLALNRFYTPEYMGASGNGGEWASVASSTLSSQLQSVLGQLTDKFTLAPSLRSEKGDFSDIEVDVALSSALLDNRLLLNGNFGYRDRATSNTTFVGDFDIEYLLNRGGNLRLKAYNHFNDQNYYLKSALTTQGIGIVYRRDFDNPFTFLRRRRKPATQPADSVGVIKD